MTDFSASFVARSLPALLDGAHVRASNGTDIALDGTLSTVSSNVPAFDRDRGVVLGAGATQSLYNTGFAGGVSGTPGTTPTGWTRLSAGAGGTRTFTAIDLGSSCRFTTFSSTDREHLLFAVAVTSGQTVTHSIKCYVHSADTVVDHVISRSAAVAASVTYRVDGVTATTATALSIGWHTVEMIHVFSATGTEAFRFGAGTGFAEARPAGGVDVTIQYPQTEVGSFRSSYIYNTSTSAALLRQPSYISSTLSALGVASQTNEYTLQIVVRMPYSSGASNPSIFPRLLSLGSTTSDDRFAIYYNPNAARFYAARHNNATNIGECSTTAGEMPWVAGDLIHVRASWGATNGLLLVTNKVGGTTYVDANTDAAVKAASPNAMAISGVSTSIIAGAANSAQNLMAETVVGFRVWDTALSQAELEALDATMFDPVVTLDGITYPATVTGANQVSITVAGIGEFDAAGDHAATPWYENVPVTLAIGDESASSTLQVVAPVPDNFGAAGASPVYPPVGLDIGDDVYVDVVSGTGSADPAGVNYIAATESVVRFRAFDQNAGLWLAYREESFAAASTGVVRSPLRGVVRSIIYSVVE